MPANVLFSPPYADRDGAYGRDFYWEETGFGRVRKLDVIMPVMEVCFLDDPEIGSGTFSEMEGFSHEYIIDQINGGDLRDAVFAGRLMARLQKEAK